MNLGADSGPMALPFPSFPLIRYLRKTLVVWHTHKNRTGKAQGEGKFGPFPIRGESMSSWHFASAAETWRSSLTSTMFRKVAARAALAPRRSNRNADNGRNRRRR